MNRHIQQMFFALAMLVLTVPVTAKTLPFVAHAGGGYQNWQYTNTLQALDFNHDYFSLFEIDLEWTSDGHLVCLHDWKGNAELIFGRRFDNPITLAEFEALVAKHPVAQNCTLKTLVGWLKSNPEKRLVTDFKTRNIEGLKQLKEYLGSDFSKHVVVQIYGPDEYVAVKEIGYEDIIWTLYRYQGGEDEILQAAKNMELFAITMPRYWALKGLAKRLPALSYVHTVNTQREWEKFQAEGIDGIYTDWIPDLRVSQSAGIDDI